jgi:hypothetical protein
VTHPYRLHAITALYSLRRAVSYLADTRDAILITRPQLGPTATRPRSLAALRAHDELLRQERVDHLQNLRQDIKPAGAMPAPTPPGLLDLERDLADGLHRVTLLVASASHRNPRLGYRAARQATEAGGFAGRCDYLAAALPQVTPRLAREVHADLEHLDRRLRTIIGLDADRWPLPGAPACPACGRRTLAAQTSAPDSAAWTVTCDSCICRGRLCPCAMTSRPPGTHHIWPADAPLVRTLLSGLAPPPTLTAA